MSITSWAAILNDARSAEASSTLCAPGHCRRERCDCCYEILNIDGSPGTRAYEFGPTPEQRMQWERTLNDKGRVPFIMYPNMCAKCGKLWPEMFSVPDKEWEQYVEKGERDKMLCKPCYDQVKIWIDQSRGTETV